MHIALTGCTGFVGAATLKALLAAGHTVCALVRNPSAVSLPSTVKIVEGSLDNDAALLQLVNNADCIVHVAGAIAARHDAEFFKVNFEGTRKLHSAAEKAHVSKFIYVSSLTARMPSISPYAASKRAAEDFLLSLGSALHITLLRPCAVYGPGDIATLPLFATLQKNIAIIPGRERARFSLIHVNDVAQIIASAVRSERHGIFEVDDGEQGHNWAALAALSKALTGLPKTVKYLPYPLAQTLAVGSEFWATITARNPMLTRAKMRELYHQDWVVRGNNWAPENAVSLDNGFKQTLEWYMREGWLPQRTTRAMSGA
jgi:2-alkyl-3-oxoalkanoate reductase